MKNLSIASRIMIIGALALVGVSALVLLSSQPVFAQSTAEDFSHPGEVEFKGVVESIQGNLITISGTTFTTTDLTFFDATLKVGDFVEVKGAMQPDGSIQALSVKLEDDVFGDDDSDFDDSNHDLFEDSMDDNSNGSTHDQMDDNTNQYREQETHRNRNRNESQNSGQNSGSSNDD